MDLRTARRRARTRPLALSALVALSATLVTVLPDTGAGASHAPVRVPVVAGLPRAQVYAAMRRAGLYFRTRGPGSAHSTWRSATAVAPKAGTLVPWHSTVVVTTSLATGHALRRVPSVAGRTRAQVYAEMRKAQLYFRTTGPGSASGKWVVALSETPRSGSEVRWHSTVVIRVTTTRPHPTTTTTRPKKRPRPTTTTTRAPTTTSSSTTSTSTTTTYPGETTTSTSSTTTAPTTTTTVRVTTTTKPKKKPVRYRIGLATWYNYIPGRCATSYLPYGTRIWVRDLANGHTISCVVTDRQGARTGRVADLSETDFSKLTALWHGVVRVKVWW